MSTQTAPPPTDLVAFLDYYLVVKSPLQIPEPGREWIVRFGPWITLVLMVLALPALLMALGVGATMAPFAGAGYAVGFTSVAVATLAELALMAAALPGLFARRMVGWRLLFYAVLVGLAGSVLSGALLSGLAGAFISLFILFQVRSRYQDAPVNAPQ